jgi:hypothetical protein
MVDSLARAINATTTVDKTFLITDYGKPFSKNGFGNRFRTWCRETELPDQLSSHGIRKAVGAVLAEAGLPSMRSWPCTAMVIRRRQRFTPAAWTAGNWWNPRWAVSIWVRLSADFFRASCFAASAGNGSHSRLRAIISSFAQKPTQKPRMRDPGMNSIRPS